MPGWNRRLFVFINASAHPAAWLVKLAIVIAYSPPFAGVALLVALWIWATPSIRGGLLSVTAAMLIGLGINQILGLLYVEPRPFMIGLGHTLLRHPPDNSFPSDHATFIWTLGIGLIATRTAPRWGAATCVYGIGVAWARIWLGLHFPIDMLASLVVAVAGGVIARAGEREAARWLLPWMERVYEASLCILHIPPSLVPRRSPEDRTFIRQ